jgi:hypothetical protein
MQHNREQTGDPKAAQQAFIRAARSPSGQRPADSKDFTIAVGIRGNHVTP